MITVRCEIEAEEEHVAAWLASLGAPSFALVLSELGRELAKRPEALINQDLRRAVVRLDPEAQEFLRRIVTMLDKP